MDEYDVLIENVNIIDGTGKNNFVGSIGIIGDKVTDIGVKVNGDSKITINESSLIAVPGFIDSHGHGELTFLFYPTCDSYVMQGVTSFIGGNCGQSLAPLGDWIPFFDIARAEDKDLFNELACFKYYPDKKLISRDKINELMKEKFGWIIDWYTVKDFFKRVEKNGISVNYAPLLGHWLIRYNAMGEDYKRKCTNTELDKMIYQIKESLKDGCIGMSVGLDYDPDCFADKKELVESIKVVSEFNGVFCPHSRRTGRRLVFGQSSTNPKVDVSESPSKHHKVNGILEAIDICRETNVRMNIAHIYTGWEISPKPETKILDLANQEATLSIIDAALKEGLDISFDVIPSGIASARARDLTTFFIPWIKLLGSKDKFKKWLNAPDFRKDIKEAIRQGKWFTFPNMNPKTNPNWGGQIVILQHMNKKYINKKISQIAKELKKDMFNTLLDLYYEDPDSKFDIASGNYSTLNSIFIKHPESAVGLDNFIYDYKYEPKTLAPYVPGISTYSGFVGFFETYVKKEKILTLEQAVYKTSTQTAKRFNLKGRGIIQKGSYADIVLMDLEKLKVNGTPLEPKKKPQGIEYVIINGKIVVKKGVHKGALPGKILKRANN